MEPGPLATLTVELLGPANPRPRCPSGDSSLGPLYPRGDPLAGALVRLTPGALGGTTDAQGRVVISGLPRGGYTLHVSAPGYVAPPDATLDVAAGQARTLTLALRPCVSAGSDRPRVGFGQSVSLGATNRCGAAWASASHSWSQVEGPDARASVKAWDGQVLTFTTLPLAKLRPLPDTPRKLSFSPDQAGQYVFRLVSKGPDGVTSRAYVMVSSTDVTGSLSSVAPGLRYYLLGNKKGPWDWAVTRWPAGWIRTLEGATSRTPSLVPLPPQQMSTQAEIVITERNSKTTFKFTVGPWNLINRDCGRSDCHPGLQAGWERTRHGSTWRRLIDGELASSRGAAAPACAACHALGHDPTADNGGYDDEARRLKAAFPAAPAAGAYARLPADLKGVSNVYCLACHGPARLDPPMVEQPGRFAVGVCARCHDRKPEQDRVAQWRTSKMSRTVTEDLNGPEARAECTRCHSAQGFYYEHFALARPPSDKVAVDICCERLEPITCQACHSPMFANDEAQLFRRGSLTTRGGLHLTGLGAGALCATCHTTDHDPDDPALLKGRAAPHSPQADLSHGAAGYDLPAAGLPPLAGVACAGAAGDSCVTCHMDRGPGPSDRDHRQVGDHTFRVTSAGGTPNLRPCQACHATMTSLDPLARGDFDGDSKVEGVRAEVDGLLAALGARLAAAVKARGYRGCGPAKDPGRGVKAGAGQKIVVVDAAGRDLGDCDQNGRIERDEGPFTFPAADLLLHKAAYNLLLVQADGSRGLHNLPYTVRLLQRTIAALAQGSADLPAWELYR